MVMPFAPLPFTWTFSTVAAETRAIPSEPIPRIVPLHTLPLDAPDTPRPVPPAHPETGQPAQPVRGPTISKPLRSMLTEPDETWIAVVFTSGTLRLPVSR